MLPRLLSPKPSPNPNPNPNPSPSPNPNPNPNKVRSSWAGFYEYNTFDQNGIIGRHPNVANMVLCNGFSGHGLQQSPAAGRAVAEIITGSPQTVDVSSLGFERVLRGEPVYEQNIV